MELNSFCPDFFSSLSLLNDNEIGRIKSDGLFGRLLNLQKLDLRRNRVTGIEENAFEGATRLTELYVIVHHHRNVSPFFSVLTVSTPLASDFTSSLLSFVYLPLLGFSF
jgi:hypothetical protein